MVVGACRARPSAPVEVAPPAVGRRGCPRTGRARASAPCPVTVDRPAVAVVGLAADRERHAWPPTPGRDAGLRPPRGRTASAAGCVTPSRLRLGQQDTSSRPGCRRRCCRRRPSARSGPLGAHAWWSASVERERRRPGSARAAPRRARPSDGPRRAPRSRSPSRDDQEAHAHLLDVGVRVALADAGREDARLRDQLLDSSHRALDRLLAGVLLDDVDHQRRRLERTAPA